MNFCISTALESLMAKAGVSGHELSRATGIKQPIIHRLLTGENTNPKIETIAPIARFFGVYISQLLGETPLGVKSDEPVFDHNDDWKRIPLITYQEALKPNALHKATQWIMANGSFSDGAFAIRITKENRTSILPEKATVIVEPFFNFKDKSFVLLNNGMVKYYLQIEQSQWLSSSMNNFDTLALLSLQEKILGRIVRVMYDV